MKKTIRTISIVALSVVFCVSAYMFASTLITQTKEKSALEDLAEMVEQARTDAKSQQASQTGETDEAVPTEGTPTEPTLLPEYSAIAEMNGDLFGWLSIEGTAIDYPVMYTPDDAQHYLHRAFDGSDAQSGTPFLDSSFYEGCGIYLIYGHHMKNGTMFGSLPEYADRDYWEAHKTIRFDTLYAHGEYEVIAAFYSRIYLKDEEGFRYYNYTDLSDPAVFDEYMEQVKAAAIFDTGLTAQYKDELLVLTTCNYHTADGRFVVVAKKAESTAST